MHMEGDVSRGIELHAHGRRRVKRDRATRTWKETCQEGDSYVHMEGDVSRGIELHATERTRDCMKHYICGSGKLECIRRDWISSGKRLRHLRGHSKNKLLQKYICQCYNTNRFTFTVAAPVK